MLKNNLPINRVFGIYSILIFLFACSSFNAIADVEVSDTKNNLNIAYQAAISSPERPKADLEKTGFVIDGSSDVLKNEEDDHTKPWGEFEGSQDRFALRFRKKD